MKCEKDNVKMKSFYFRNRIESKDVWVKAKNKEICPVCEDVFTISSKVCNKEN